MINTIYEIRCDGGNKFQRRYCSASLTGPLKADLKAKAKAAGWSFRRSFLWLETTAICSACQAAARGETSVDQYANTALKVVGES